MLQKRIRISLTGIPDSGKKDLLERISSKFNTEVLEPYRQISPMSLETFYEMFSIQLKLVSKEFVVVNKCLLDVLAHLLDEINKGLDVSEDLLKLFCECTRRQTQDFDFVFYLPYRGTNQKSIDQDKLLGRVVDYFVDEDRLVFLGDNESKEDALYLLDWVQK